MPSTAIQSSLPFVSYSVYIHIYTITNALFIETILGNVKVIHSRTHYNLTAVYSGSAME